MPSASFAMKDPTFEDEYYKRYAVSVASTTPSQYDWELKKCASIDSESMLEPEYPRPTRLYQCALVLAGFFATFQTIGLNQTYGIFQDFYTSSESNIIDGPGRYAMASLIGTIGGGLTWSGSVFVAMLISKGCDMCVMCLSGAALMSLGFILASLATRLWQLFLTQAILVGIGSSMLYYPVISLTPVFFDRHRGFAMGIAMAGSGAGGLVLAPVTQALLVRYGAPVTLRILGVWNFVICVAISFVIRPHPAYKPIRPSLALAKRGAFILQLFAAFFQAAGNIIPLYYLTTYSTYVLGLSPTAASMLLAVNNGVNSVARVAMGLIADHVGRQNTLVGCVIFSAVSVVTLWIHASHARFLAFIILYGMASGGYSALLPTTITEIYGKEHYSSANAAIYFVRGLGAVLGAPIAGSLLGAHPGSGQLMEPVGELMKRFDRVAGYDAGLLLAAGVCVVFVRWFDSRAKGKWKWIA
ncbi:MFS general substrate transporter [Russula ochroleuca]|jgi:MFS family permease|uniref:MFS general substrate transporter n=1 Tax=Russula ochroleuca TaxID=152965 RepID=A0A9P5MYB9_9AGAM|nr:MFS general substrate transporter [Russula ochroleuca]